MENKEPQNLASTLTNYFSSKYSIADGNTYSIMKDTTELYLEFQDIYFDETLSIGDLAKWLNNNGYKIGTNGQWMLLENDKKPLN